MQEKPPLGGDAPSTPPGRAEQSQPALARFGAVLTHVPGYTRLAWSLLRDRRLSARQRAMLIAGLTYLALPLDLVPGIIPVAGQLDDLAAILLALRAVTRSLPPVVADEHLRGAGVDPKVMDEDLRSLGATAAWLAASVGALAWRLAGRAAGGALKGIGRAVRRAR